MRVVVAIAVALLPCASIAEDQSKDLEAAKIAIDRGLAFLAKDALKWKEEHRCVSCHHAALVVWAQREARQQGHAVDEPVLAELTDWMAKSGNGKTGVPRPAGRPKALNTKAVYFALALGADREPDAASKEAMKLLLETVQGDQLENGGWHAWPDTRPPFFGPSDDTATALATLALAPAAATDESAKAARDRGVAWLAAAPIDAELQSMAMRLVLWQRLERSAAEIQPLVKGLTERQKPDGGWSQTADMASDAWATGQALYALASAGAKADDPIIRRGRDFLVKTQRDDGSWAMTSRPCPPTNAGATNLIPITGGGSAWGVLGLVKSR